MANKSNVAEPSRYVPTEEKKGNFDDYEVRDALRTLSQADKIRKNKPLMGAIRKEAQKQLKVAQATATQLQGGK